MNGLDKCFNQTLQNMLVKFVSKRIEEWSFFLDILVFAYNTSHHSSTKCPSFSLMFGCQVTIPIDVDLQKQSVEECKEWYRSAEQPDMSVMAAEHAHLLKKAKENILLAQKKQTVQYNRKHSKPDEFKKGQLVLKKDFTRKKNKRRKTEGTLCWPIYIVLSKNYPMVYMNYVTRMGELF